MKRHESRNETVSALAADYALENMASDDRTAFEAHMLDCAVCRDELTSIRALTVSLTEPVTESAARPELWGRIEERLGLEANTDDTGAKFLRAADGVGWEPAPIPGVLTRILLVDRERDRVTFEAKLEPGATYPEHEHAGPEECFVLSGDLWVGNVQMHAGDFQNSEASSTHAAQTTDGGCHLLLIGCIENSPLAWGASG